MHIKTLKTFTYYYYYNTNNNSGWRIINLTTHSNIFKIWGEFALWCPKIQTFSNENVLFEDKQPTEVLLKQNYTNMYQVKSPETLFVE